MSCQTLTPEEKIAIKAKIVRLEAAYDDLLSGKAIKRFVDQNGEQVEYTPANADKLLAYIKQLTALVNPQFARCFKPRPIGFIFPRQ
jgi:hypothetical protein